MSTPIAALYYQSFKPAFHSAQNAVVALADFMYGTEARTNITSLFAFALLVIGTVTSIYATPAIAGLPVCAL